MSLDTGATQTTADADIPTPPTLYKYYSFNEWTEAIFERNQVYFQSPDCFNDPFDSKMSTTYEGDKEQRIDRLIDFWRKGPFKDKPKEDLHRQASEVVERGKDISLIVKTLEDSSERRRKQMGVFCMAQRKNNLLMWSHYADSHKGFCLEFQTNNSFFGEAQPLVDRYSSDRPCLNLIKEPSGDDYVEALLTKSIDWKYEEEWRVIEPETSSDTGPGIKSFPADALSAVILGCKITPENRHRIKQWCRSRNPQPAIYWAEEKGNEFGLDLRLMF